MNRLEVLNLTGCLIGSIGAMHLFLALEDALEKSHAATGATRAAGQVLRRPARSVISRAFTKYKFLRFSRAIRS